jgi:hypothetical protein
MKLTSALIDKEKNGRKAVFFGIKEKQVGSRKFLSKKPNNRVMLLLEKSIVHKVF